MNFLIDAQLPRRVARKLRELGYITNAELEAQGGGAAELTRLTGMDRSALLALMRTV